MTTIFGVPMQALFGQLLLGLINGSFYAILSLGLAIIFGLLNIINFAHGALYMMGAFVAWILLNYIGVSYWWALVLVPVIVGFAGVLIERNLIGQLNSSSKGSAYVLICITLCVFLLGSNFYRVVWIVAPSFMPNWWAAGIDKLANATTTMYLFVAIMIGIAGAEVYRRVRPSEGAVLHIDHLYGLLLTFGLALIIQGMFRNEYGVSGLPYAIPPELSGGQRLPFMFLPNYRGWVVVASLTVCIATWLVIEKTKLGAYLRAATENPTLVQAFGVNVPLFLTLTYGFGVALAGFAGVLAAPIYSVNPNMGADIIIVVFAVVVIGGMGSIIGSVITGFTLGLVEGLTKVFYPEASATVIFVIMVLVLLVKPAGLFGRTA